MTDRPSPLLRPNCQLSNLWLEGGRKQCYGHPDGSRCPAGLPEDYSVNDIDKARLLGFLTFLALGAAIIGPVLLMARCGL